MSGHVTPVVLRQAEAVDAEAIAALHADSWQRTYRGMMPDEFLDKGALADRQRVWHERLSVTDASRLVVAAAGDDDVLIGFICAFAREDPVWGAFIDNLHVVHRMHRRGVGRRLLAAVGQWLVDRGADEGVYLWVMEANAPARRFYERLGATHAGTEIHQDPGGGSAPNCRYVWPSPVMLL